MKGIKFLLSLGFLSVLTSSSFAQTILPFKSDTGLTTHCNQGKNSKVKLCETTRNGKIVRKIFYSNGKVLVGNTYYASGRTAKLIMFYKGQLEGFFVYPDQELNPDTANGYSFSFKNGKLEHISNSSISLYQRCIEDTPNGTKCDELNYFILSEEKGLHPVFALPKENQGLSVLESNGIKIP